MATNIDRALDKLLDTARKLRLLATLSVGQVNRVADAKHVLTTVQLLERRKKYKLFLHDVLRESGPAAVLVCALALGQGRITDLTAFERTQLCKVIAENKVAISHPTVGALATVHKIPNTADDIPLTLPNAHDIVVQKTPHKRRRTAGTAHSTPVRRLERAQVGFNLGPQVGSNTHNIASPLEQRMIENASIEGTEAVFGEYLCHAIRKIHVGGQLRAAVTTVLPKWGGPVDCLISLDICEDEVDQLVLALFNTTVTWVEQDLHVVMRDGFTMILSGPEAEVTLKGATNEAIIHVFGSETWKAVNDSRVRKRECDEGKHLTQCVSMILTKSGAIVSISLGLEGGIQIQNRLYA